MRPTTDTPALELARGLSPQLTPAGIFLSGEDHLRLTTFNSATGVELALEGRQLLANGDVVALRERHVPNTDRTSASSTFPLAPGWLQGIQVRATAGTPRRGQCFAIVELVRGAPNTSAQPLETLLAGYVTDTSRRAWPRAPLELMPEGPGNIRVITGSDPAAGAEISETVPANARWRLIALRVALTTDVTAGSRNPALLFDDGASIYMSMSSMGPLTASLTANFCWATGAALPIFATNSSPTSAIPTPNMLMGGHRIRTSTSALAAGDNYGAPIYEVEEWIED